MRTFITILMLLCPFLCSTAQEVDMPQTDADSSAVTALTEEELAEIREKHIEELLPNTRSLVFIDSLVVDKDNFLSQLRLTEEIGTYTLPDAIIPRERIENTETGQTVFINSLQNTAFLALADSVGTLRLNALFRNAGQWTDPQPIAELCNFTYQDFPFLCTDGSTLYFSAAGPESIGGLDLFVTRYSEETRQFVRPQNLGFPYNSPANDYLLAIDEELGIGVLVSDRQQPDDKVCIYWFIEEEQRDVYDYDPDDEENVATVQRLAAISSIADSQVGHETDIRNVCQHWEATLQEQNKEKDTKCTYIIDNDTTYDSLDEFRNSSARDLAEQWIAAQAELRELETRQQQMRDTYAETRDTHLIATLQDLEARLSKQRALVRELAKQYRAAEK